jgi:hypothetical protein
MLVVLRIFFFFRDASNNNGAEPFFLLHGLLRMRILDQLASSYQASQSSSKLPNIRKLRMLGYALTFPLLSKLFYLNKKGTDWLYVCHLLFLNSVHDWFGFLCCCYYCFYYKEIFSTPTISFLFLSYSDDISYANIRVEKERGRPALNSLSYQSFFYVEEFILSTQWISYSNVHKKWTLFWYVNIHY